MYLPSIIIKTLSNGSCEYFSLSSNVYLQKISSLISYRCKGTVLLSFCSAILLIYRHICRIPLFTALARIKLETDQAMLDVSSTMNHQIKKLHAESQLHSEEMMVRPSTSLPEAVAEYQRRYKRLPPPGFDKSHKFAVESNASIIDNF